ncbi:MAG TPA: hypothetical protein ENG70_01610 [Candidatus Cloacimonetes bacterium]|nr:hypothetical protein [Candidatus Cloacimonadota bacterium]HEX37547.1 hypothetical protein [Candidatus Cloacimonadota bacterium]
MRKKVQSQEKKKIQPILYIIAALIFINPLFFTTQKLLFFPVKILIQQFITILLLSFFIFSRKYSNISIKNSLVFASSYLVFIVLRIIFQATPAWGFDQFYYIFTFFTIYFVLSQLHLNKFEKQFLALTFITSFLFSIIPGMIFQIQYTNFSDFRRLVLGWANANYLASYMLIIIGFCIYVWKQATKKWKRYLSLISMILSIIFLVWTQSRGALLSLVIISVLSFFIHSIIRRSKKFIAISSILFALIIVGSIVAFRLVRPQTVIFRSRIYQADLSYLKDHWLIGSGIGTFMHEYPQYRFVDYKLLGQEDVISHAHNEIIEIFAESGIIGLILFLIFLYALYKRAAILWKDQNNYFTLTACFSISLLLFQNMFSITMRIPAILFYFFILGGFISADYIDKRSEQRRTISKYYAIPLIVLLIICTYFQLKNIIGLSYFQKAKDLQAQQEEVSYKKAIIETEKAYEFIPNNTELLYQQGVLYTLNQELIKAEQSFDRLERLSPYYPQLHFWKGYMYSLMDKWNNAIDEYLIEISLNEYPKVYFNLAIAYHFNQDETSSMVYFLEYIEKVIEKIDKNIILEKSEIVEQEEKNLRFAFSQLEKFNKKNLKLLNILQQYKSYIFRLNQ